MTTTMIRRYIFVMALLLAVLSSNSVEASATTTTEKCLYKLLGVPKTATTQQIKQAYRRKALDTHPDKVKHKNIPADQAAAAFHAVVQAFEVLSDPNSRARYDRTGSSTTTNNAGGNGGYGGGGGGQQHVQFTWSWNFNSRPKRQQRLKDKFEVQQAQSRVLHIVSLEQLRTIMLNDQDQLERNLLLCFVTPGDVETIANDEIVFPYPFAGMSSQGIWWEDSLQTALVRFHRTNDVAAYFGIPRGDELRRQGQGPIFVFGRQGQSMNDDNDNDDDDDDDNDSDSSSSRVKSWPRLQTKNRQVFETWTWEQIRIEVFFVNQHSHPVELYWIHGTRAHLKEAALPPGATFRHTTMLTHEWHARDARVDTHHDSPGRWKLTEESTIQSWKFGNDTSSPQTVIIPRRTCFDLSGHCSFWKHQRACIENPVFMQEQCPLTCNFCSRQQEQEQLAREEEEQQLLLQQEQQKEEERDRETARLLQDEQQQQHQQQHQQQQHDHQPPPGLDELLQDELQQPHHEHDHPQQASDEL
jgi:curved DNA-binding protein CbpA